MLDIAKTSETQTPYSEAQPPKSEAQFLKSGAQPPKPEARPQTAQISSKVLRKVKASVSLFLIKTAD